MKTFYFVDRDGEEWTVEAPEVAQPFGIGAVCPSCNPDATLHEHNRRHARVIEMIDFEKKIIWCGVTDPTSGCVHPFPPVTLEIHDGGRRLAPSATITDHRTGAVTERAMHRKESP
ncbi:MAG TPA: hypothetical protein VJU58_06170 [Microbacterium sp.]|nr:hypothetical protein [Microbacterium sp.]